MKLFAMDFVKEDFFDNLFLKAEQYFAIMYKKNKKLKDYFHGVVSLLWYHVKSYANSTMGSI